MFNKRTTRFIAIFTLLVLPFCSPLAIAEEDLLDFDFDLANWFEIEGVGDLVSNFSRFVYVMNPEGDELTQIIYEYLGKETIDGVELEKVSMRGSSPSEEQEMLFWIDRDGQMNKVIDNQSGEEIPLMFAGFVTMFFFLPFYMADAFDIEGLLLEDTEGEVIVLTDVSERTFGDLTADIFFYTLTAKDDAGEDVLIFFEIGDFGDFQIMVSFDIDAPDEEETFGFWVEEIVLH